MEEGIAGLEEELHAYLERFGGCLKWNRWIGTIDWDAYVRSHH